MFYIIIWNLHAIYCIIDFEQYILYSIYDILQLVHNRKYMTLYSVILWYMYTYMQTCTELQNEPCPPSFCNDADSRMSSNHGVVSPRRWDVLSSHRSCGAQHPETSFCWDFYLAVLPSELESLEESGKHLSHLRAPSGRSSDLTNELTPWGQPHRVLQVDGGRK